MRGRSVVRAWRGVPLVEEVMLALGTVEMVLSRARAFMEDDVSEAAAQALEADDSAEEGEASGGEAEVEVGRWRQ